MDHTKEAENYLSHYAGLKKSVAHAAYMIEKLAFKARPQEVSAVRHDITGISARRAGNTLQEIYELQKWQEFHQESMEEIRHIEELLSELDEKESELLQLWYIQKKPVVEIMAEMDYETRQAIYNLKSKAIKNFSVNLFGISALRAI